MLLLMLRKSSNADFLEIFTSIIEQKCFQKNGGTAVEVFA